VNWSYMRNAAIIGVASGWGARDHGCEEGPRALQASGITRCLHDAGQAGFSFETLQVADDARHESVLARVVDIDLRLALLVSAMLKNTVLPVVVGGDHACAVGTWSGVRAALPPDEELGLIWVDAHMDSHVPATSPSGALHGMPLACLLGEGPAPLTNLAGPAPKLRSEHVCLVGVRSFERGEQALLESLGVRVFFMEEVRARGFDTVWREAVQRVSHGTAGYGISVDLDAMDPVDAPGVGTPEGGGIEGDELSRALRTAHDDVRLLAVEFAEYNPHLDRKDITLKLLRRLICAVAAGKDRDG
jgi:arginase